MSSLSALTLHANKKTTGRRSSRINQLTCKGRLCSTFTPEVVQCTVMGEGYDGPEWSCVAELPDGIKMGSVEVGCEVSASGMGA